MVSFYIIRSNSYNADCHNRLQMTCGTHCWRKLLHNFSDVVFEKDGLGHCSKCTHNPEWWQISVDTATSCVSHDSPTRQQVWETCNISVIRCRYTEKVYKNTYAIKKNEFLNSVTIPTFFLTPNPRLIDSLRTIFPAKHVD